LKYKKEIVLLLIAIVLFSISAFFYSYNLIGDTFAFGTGLSSYPYRIYAFGFVGFGSALMLMASISFSKHNKNLRNKSYQI
jgi:hypothetical protein